MEYQYLYTCLIEEQDTNKPFVQVFWTYASEIGIAIDKTLRAAKTIGLLNPKVNEIDPYDIDNLDLDVTYNEKRDVFWSSTRYFFPPEPCFELPTGIISSCIEGEYDADEISRGYSISQDDELIKIEVNAEKIELLNVYSSLINKFKVLKVFWYLLHGHGDDTEEDLFYVNESLDTPEKISAHIYQNLCDSLDNGYVTLTSYVADGSTNINISDHKKIVVNTYSKAIADLILECLEKFGFTSVDPFVTIDQKIHHWHYKLAKSRNKKQLISHLISNGFSVWKPGK